MIPNKGVFIGHSSRLKYDIPCYEDEIRESTAPLSYKLNPNQINNCEGCLSVFGPRSASYGISTTTGHRTAEKQFLTDVESILSNRNVIASRCRDGKVNKINVTKFGLKHARICNDFLDPIATHLTNPAQNYREIGINRFYDLPTHPQSNIFYDFSVNTQLEAKDNYREKIPKLMPFDPSLPKEIEGSNKPCRYKCSSNCQ